MLIQSRNGSEMKLKLHITSFFGLTSIGVTLHKASNEANFSGLVGRTFSDRKLRFQIYTFWLKFNRVNFAKLNVHYEPLNSK